MAKNNNLTDFLTDVADAIRAKKGTTAKINPQNFASEIATIQGGGGLTPRAVAKDVNFFDADGTILYSYTKEEFLSLDELPQLPTLEGLICQGWNWALEDAQAHVAKYTKLVVGAMYITDDGATRLYINIAAPGRQTLPLYFRQSESNGVTIDWGDGVSETLSGTGVVDTQHTYAEIGSYTITLMPTDTCALQLGGGTNVTCVFGNTGQPGKVYCDMLKRVEHGKNVTILQDYAFYCCTDVGVVTIPDSVTSIGRNILSYVYALKHLTIPPNVTTIGTRSFYYSSGIESISLPNTFTTFTADLFYSCVNLKYISLPESVKTFNVTNIFYTCQSLDYMHLPDNITAIGSSAFYSASAISKIILPASLKSIGTSAFSTCFPLASLDIPPTVATISATAFNNCAGMKYYDFSRHTSVPTLSNKSAFTGIQSDCSIIVPDSLYDSWIAATNWSSLTANIIKKSEWDAQQ